MKTFRKIIPAVFAVSLAFSAVSATASADEMNGFTQAEIDASTVKPVITLESKVLTAEEAKDSKYIEIPVNVSGADLKYASTGLHIYYDSRLEIPLNALGFPDVEAGSAIDYLSASVPSADPSAEEMGMKGVFLTTAGAALGGMDGTMWTLKFELPDDAESGDVFPIDIIYRENNKTSSMFSDVSNTRNGRLISAYTFTRGIYNGTTNSFMPDSQDIERCYALAEISPSADGYIAIEDSGTSVTVPVKNCGDANCDGTVDLADATSIIQHIGNEGKYALSAKGFINADTNGDGAVTGADAIIIQRIEAGEYSISDLPIKK